FIYHIVSQSFVLCFFFFQAEDGIRDFHVTGVQTCALPILLFKGKRYVTPIFRTPIRNGIVAISFVLCGVLGYWVLNHLPIIDFRAYKVGTNIPKAMEIPENAPKSEDRKSVV